jgi:hypothetical protein
MAYRLKSPVTDTPEQEHLRTPDSGEAVLEAGNAHPDNDTHEAAQRSCETQTDVARGADCARQCFRPLP